MLVPKLLHTYHLSCLGLLEITDGSELFCELSRRGKEMAQAFVLVLCRKQLNVVAAVAAWR